MLLSKKPSNHAPFFYVLIFIDRLDKAIFLWSKWAIVTHLILIFVNRGIENKFLGNEREKIVKVWLPHRFTKFVIFLFMTSFYFVSSFLQILIID